MISFFFVNPTVQKYIVILAGDLNWGMSEFYCEKIHIFLM